MPEMPCLGLKCPELRTRTEGYVLRYLLRFRAAYFLWLLPFSPPAGLYGVLYVVRQTLLNVRPYCVFL